jgi:hypothetical protein
LRWPGYFRNCGVDFSCLLRAGQIRLRKYADATRFIIDNRHTTNAVCPHEPFAGIQALLWLAHDWIARNIRPDWRRLWIQPCSDDLATQIAISNDALHPLRLSVCNDRHGADIFISQNLGNHLCCVAWKTTHRISSHNFLYSHQTPLIIFRFCVYRWLLCTRAKVLPWIRYRHQVDCVGLLSPCGMPGLFRGCPQESKCRILKLRLCSTPYGVRCIAEGPLLFNNEIVRNKY